jgi:peptidyl-Asp metalloendopeptidase
VKFIKFLIPFWVAGVLLFPLSFLNTASRPTQAQAEGLFVPVVYDSGPEASGIHIIRTRYVQPQFALLTSADMAPSRENLALNLFADVSFTGIIDEIQSNSSGSTTWIGHLEDKEFGTFTLVARADILMGTIKTNQVSYRITYLPTGIHAIQELDEAAFPAELEPIKSQIASVASDSAANHITADDGSNIDVLVVYTQDARSNYSDGSTAAIQTLIDLAVAETNTGYANSVANQRISLVHTAEVTYNESSFNWNSTLVRLKEPSDNYMDYVHTLRNNYCADEVVLIVDNYDSCGLAYVMDTIDDAFKDWAFAVVSRNCATGYYSFGHELGHNMGTRHDWYVDSTNTYAHAFSNVTDSWRTIMAYNDECDCSNEISPCPAYSSRSTKDSPSCSRLNYWSSPDVQMGGDDMGVIYSAPTTCSTGTPSGVCAADNTYRLNQTATTVANFRESSLCAAQTYTLTGNVQTNSGAGVNNVIVDFSGPSAPISTTTNATGAYSQTGFANSTTYTVTFDQTGYVFSPAETTVVFSGLDKTQNATGYPAASLVFTETFETGIFGDSWLTETITEGRVVISTTWPYTGSYSLILDDDSPGGNYSFASAALVVDLDGQSDVNLSFWYRDFNDDSHPTEDGVFISDDQGETWYQAFQFANSMSDFSQTIISLDQAASAAGMSFNDRFMIKFQFYDNYPITSDGYSIDNICVGCQIIYLPLILR